MPLKVTLQKQLKPGLYIGHGFNVSKDTQGPADVLIRVVDKNKLQLCLESKEHISKIYDREVLHYVDPPIVEVPKAAIGTEVEFSQFHFQLKK